MALRCGLVDGAIVSDYSQQFSNMVTGIQPNVGGTLQSTWATPHSATTATVWMTNQNSAYGILLPRNVVMQWRDGSGVWHSGGAVVPSTSCGPSPCAQLRLPSGTMITGVMATFPPDTSLQGWYMVSEISTQ